MVNGKGKVITDDDLVQAASIVDVSKSFVIEVIQRVDDSLSMLTALKEAQNHSGLRVDSLLK